MMPLSLMAQSYTVYSVIGSAKVQNGKQMVPLKPRKMVTAQTKIQIGEESAVTIIDEQNAKLYSFTLKGIMERMQILDSVSDKGG